MPDSPSEKSDVYPPTIWSRYRENAIHWIVLAGMVAVAAGVVLHLEWLKHLGLGAAALAVLSVVPVLVFEYRADARFVPSAGLMLLAVVFDIDIYEGSPRKVQRIVDACVSARAGRR